MRNSVTQNGIIVKAYAGSTGVLLAFNLQKDSDAEGLLGFAIQRDNKEWLPAMIPFPGKPHPAGEPIPTNEAPVQKFRWTDYTVDAGTTYKYKVFAVKGTPDKLELGAGAEISITTEPRDVKLVLGHPDRILTVSNRAVASSQAFSRLFPETTGKLDAALAKKKPAGQATKTEGILTGKEMTWLSNGLLEEIVAFIGLAKDSTFALDVAIYQYELDQIVSAINAAKDAGAKVRLIYHAKPGDGQTDKNVASAAHLAADEKFGRVTSAIFHHKFIVLSKLNGEARTPIAVLCGSTNFTSNGVFAQANNVQITSNPAIIQKYAEQFEFLFQQPSNTPPVTATHDTEQNVLDPAAGLQVGFSPRKGRGDLTFFATLINGAKQDVFFATAFGLDQTILDALQGQPHDSILRYGVEDKQEKGDKNITGIHGDRTADFEAASTLPKGLDGWLEEHRTPGALGNILIHDKIIVIDFTTDSPVVINGSHNYSNNASAANDENYLIIRGNTAVADCLGVEVIRLYDHYRFRFVTTKNVNAGGANAAPKGPMTLDTTGAWLKPYYDPTNLKCADRLIFSGSAAAGGSVAKMRSAAGAPGTSTAEAAAADAKPAAKKVASKKVASKKAPAKTAAVKKAPPAATKAAAKKAPAKKAPAKKAPAKKAPAKKAAAKKAAAKKR